MRVRICGLVAATVIAAMWTTVSAGGASAELRTTFEEGNALYRDGDFTGAIDRYEALVAAGVRDADLYYNLGNAYYKDERLGKAVLYYERSLRMSPRDKDTRENLDLVRSQLKDKQFVPAQNRLVRAAVFLHNNLNTSEMSVMFSVWYSLLCVLVIILSLHDTQLVRSVYRRVSVLSLGRFLGLRYKQDLMLGIAVIFVLAATSGASLYVKTTRDHTARDAVVIDRDVPVYSGPTKDATLQFRIHEGTMVRVSDSRADWKRVRLPGGLSGWVASRALESV